MREINYAQLIALRTCTHYGMSDVNTLKLEKGDRELNDDPNILILFSIFSFFLFLIISDEIFRETRKPWGGD